jgi:hypothetical protein
MVVKGRESVGSRRIVNGKGTLGADSGKRGCMPGSLRPVVGEKESTGNDQRRGAELDTATCDAWALLADGLASGFAFPLRNVAVPRGGPGENSTAVWAFRFG